ncbi:hypothetical protein [Actinomadura sp. 3N508]|uniref:hypothetical protein n=1 Tax=Actinomadura sp. 3N508 TaxID=3375153 RepID=UPI0037ADEB70
MLAIKAEQGMDVSPQVRDHLTGLQLAALQVAHPHEYRVRLVRDELHVAVVGQREAEIANLTVQSGPRAAARHQGRTTLPSPRRPDQLAGNRPEQP